MLTSLVVRNFALIDRLELTFGTGLNVLTGETGAGKSIIIDALGVALGDRVSADSVRSGSDRLAVEAHFDLRDSPQSTLTRLADDGLENEDDPALLVLFREVTRGGKSQSRVNGRLVPTSVLRTIGQDLVDVHGQHEHQSLLQADTHVDLLDNWLGPELLSLRSRFSLLFHEVTSLNREIEILQSESRERARHLDLYRFQQREIEDAALKADELDTLSAERNRLSNLEKLTSISKEAYGALSETAQDAISSSLGQLNRIVDLDVALTPIVEQATESAAYLEEAATLLRKYIETLEVEPGRLESINERLDLIHSLTRKYGNTIQEILSYSDELDNRISLVENSDAREQSLKDRLSLQLREAEHIAEELSKKRLDGAVVFGDAIIKELADLSMNQTHFNVSVQETSLNAKGKDRVEFLISTNPGEPLRPLAKIASGGETSRLMLAIKSVLARSSFVPTMIFDEIDTGIGGRTGRVLAEKLSSLSQIAQILCITHLPQIAARPAASHFSIEKSVANGRTTVGVASLNRKEREIEIARMLGGGDSDTVMQHAREMLSAP